MLEWFNSLPDSAKGAAFGALIGSLGGFTIGIITLLTKDFLFPILSERRNRRAAKRKFFYTYATPLVGASISWLYRIRDIFYRGDFLLESAPQTEFNKYKYISSVYRLCALLGWIRASKIEASHIEVQSTREYEKIEKAMSEFETSLANGEHIEQSVLNNLASLWDFTISELEQGQKDKLGVSIERIVEKFCFDHNVTIPLDAMESEHLFLAQQLHDCIKQKSSSKGIDELCFSQTIPECIREVSRIQSWIYRDWQSAIGDLMIKKTEISTGRKIEVVGFKDFESFYETPDSSERVWKDRIDNLFFNLDVEVEDKYDARTLQLKRNYQASYKLLKAFAKVQTGNVNIAKKALRELKYLDSKNMQVSTIEKIAAWLKLKLSMPFGSHRNE